LQQRPSPNLNVNCLTLIYRLCILKRLLIQPCTHHKLKRNFSLFAFTVLALVFKFYMNMNMNTKMFLIYEVYKGRARRSSP